jgi:hypothetical protein
MVLTIETLTEIYPEHIWIDLSETVQIESKLSAEQLGDRDYNLNRVDLNQLCMVAVKKWLSEVFDLELKSVFPCTFGGKENLEFISGLVNGFAIQIGKTRLVFIPSQSIDLSEIEIPQEWVDLPNWAGDYYVPIQVNLIGKYLHLWTFISHYDLKNNGEFDRVLRNYEIPDGFGTKNLDVLFTACELHSLGELTPKRAVIDPIPALSVTDVNKIIEQLLQHRSGFSPRLESAFSEWGAILNDSNNINDYFKAIEIKERKVEIEDKELESVGKNYKLLDDMFNGLYPLWEKIENFINPSVPQMAFRGVRNSVSKLRPQKTYRGIPLETPEEINAAIHQLYINESSIPTPTSITGVEDLVILMENSTNANIRWKATEYLWIINPTHPQLPPTSITDIGIQFETDSLALMISRLSLANGHRAILLRIYPISANIYLPAEVKLLVLDENGEPISLSKDKYLEAISRVETQDSYIQLYFVADPLDRFSVCVTLDKQKFVEQFIV